MNQAPNGNNAASLSVDQLQQLNQWFRSKKDLYKYLDQVVQIYLPREKSCTIQVSDPWIQVPREVLAILGEHR